MVFNIAGQHKRQVLCSYLCQSICLQFPHLDCAVVGAGGQHPGLLGVPTHTIDVCCVCLLHSAQQGEEGFVWGSRRRRILQTLGTHWITRAPEMHHQVHANLMEYSDAVITTCRGYEAIL